MVELEGVFWGVGGVKVCAVGAARHRGGEAKVARCNPEGPADPAGDTAGVGWNKALSCRLKKKNRQKLAHAEYCSGKGHASVVQRKPFTPGSFAEGATPAKPAVSTCRSHPTHLKQEGKLFPVRIVAWTLFQFRKVHRMLIIVPFLI